MKRPFLDADVLVRLSVSGATTSGLLFLATLNTPVQYVTSAYAMREMYGCFSDDDWPPRAAIACVMAVGRLLVSSKLYVRETSPSQERIDALRECCTDKKDIPILADAIDEGCSVVLTTDGQLLKSTAGIPCMTPDEWLSAIGSDEEVRAVLQAFAAPLLALPVFQQVAAGPG